MDSYIGALWPVCCNSVSFRDTLNGQQPEMRCHMMWRVNGNFYSFWVRKCGSNRKALCTLHNDVFWVKSECLNFTKVRETQNKHCAKYSEPLCCSHKGWLTFGGWEDWDLRLKNELVTQRFREPASSMQLLLEFHIDNCVIEKEFSLYGE